MLSQAMLSTPMGRRAQGSKRKKGKDTMKFSTHDVPGKRGSKPSSWCILCFASAAFITIGTSMALAEEPIATAGLEEITVTARRVMENLQTLPLTVNVLTPSALADKGISDLSAAERRVGGSFGVGTQQDLFPRHLVQRNEHWN
jgi:hypothetical protein